MKIIFIILCVLLCTSCNKVYDSCHKGVVVTTGTDVIALDLETHRKIALYWDRGDIVDVGDTITIYYSRTRYPSFWYESAR